MHQSKIKQRAKTLIGITSWEQLLFTLSQLALEEKENLEEFDDSEMANKYSKLASELHDLSNLVG